VIINKYDKIEEYDENQAQKLIQKAEELTNLKYSFYHL